MLNIRAKCSVQASHSLNNKSKTLEQSLTVAYILLHAEQSNLTVLLSHYNIAKLFNDQILFSPVTDCAENKHYKRSFFLSDFLLYHTAISGIIDHYCIIGNFKKLGKIKNKLRTICTKNHESFKNNKSRVQFYWFSLKNMQCTVSK